MSTTLQYFVAGKNEQRCLGLTNEEHNSHKGSVNTRQPKKTEDEKTKANRIVFDIWDRNLEKEVITKKVHVHFSSVIKGAQQFDMQSVEEVVCGSYCTFFKTYDGRVYTCGENEYGQCAVGDTTNISERPVLCLPLLQLGPIKYIRTGSLFTIFVNYRGEVYGFGNNYYGQLCSTPNTVNTEAVHIDQAVHFSGDNVITVSTGSLHSAFLTSDGRVWTAGSNDEGQLGIGESDDIEDDEEIVRVDKPRVVKLSKNPVLANDVKCGRHHTIVLVKTGDILVFGSMKNGQCGSGNGGKIATPTLLKQPANTLFKQIWVKSDTTFLLSTDGKLYGCGRGIEGNFGDGKPIANNDGEDTEMTEKVEAKSIELRCQNLAVPTLLDNELPFKVSDIKDIVQGGFCTFVILKDSKSIYASGGNRYGQLLLDVDKPSVMNFTKIELDPEFVSKIQKQGSPSLEFCVAAGEVHSVLYFRDAEKSTSPMQWFGVNYSFGGNALLSGFDDIDIICTRKHLLERASDEPSAKRRKLD